MKPAEPTETGLRTHSVSRGRRWAYSLFAFLCLGWLLFRSGRKPSRLRYPCQQVALANSAWLVPAVGLGLARLVGSRRFQRAVTVPLLVLIIALMAVGLGGESSIVASVEVPFLSEARLRASALTPQAWQGGQADGNHDVFVVNNVPVPQAGGFHHTGVDGLIRLLSDGGIDLYRSDSAARAAGTDGLIESDDIVLIKVNAAYDQRGMTNGDVLRGLITAILEHPDGFTGEAVVVENCEGGPDYNQTYNNAENIYQTFYDVINSFGDPSRVSCSSWWSFTDNRVAEYDTGDYGQGYVWLGNNVSYPKFTTGRGTHISLRNGVWTGSGYDKSNIKLINVPVLKSHHALGATICVKNYMGVPSIHMTTNVHSDLLHTGFTGRVMNETMYPCLNILDAIWTSPAHPDGPAAPYSKAVRTNMLLAGVDPVALDYYASKHVLYAVSGYGRHDPDTSYTENTNPYHDGTLNTGYPYDALRIMLQSNASELRGGGHDVTMDPALMNIYTRDLGEGIGRSGGHCLTGLNEPSERFYFAEGTTRTGFDEWISLSNPGEGTANCVLDFMTGEGETTPYDVEVPPGSRATVSVNSVLGEGKDVSCVVTSDSPVVAERPIYFNYGGSWTGGHVTSGATSTGKTWYFAEGYTGPGFDEYVCVLNPGDTPANLSFTFQTQEEGEVVRTGQAVPAGFRATFKVNDLLGSNYQCSLRLESDQPVVAERAMYFDYMGRDERHWSGGHCLTGLPELSDSYCFGEGTTRTGFDEWLTLQNPHPDPIRIDASYLLGVGQGGPVEKAYEIAPGERYTVYVADEVGVEKDVSVELSSSSTFMAERPLYFSYPGEEGDWKGGHCVAGVQEPGEEWYFAEGCTRDDFQEWLCLGNPGGEGTQVEIVYEVQGSGSLPPKIVGIPAKSRVTVDVNTDAGADLDVSCRFRVVSGPGIVVERPMYFDY